MEENDFEVLADCAGSNGLYGFERNYTIDPQKLRNLITRFLIFYGFCQNILRQYLRCKIKADCISCRLLSFASGAFPKVKAFYADTYIEANIFGFLLGYSGSGKSKLALL